MSKAAVIVAALVLVAGAVITLLAYRMPTTGDGQEALVIPFIVFWTALAVGLVWLLDWVIRGIRREKRR